MIRILTLAAIIIPAFAFAQEGNWETYMSRIDNKPASFLVDLSLKQKAPDKILPYLVICGPKSRTCKGNGLPENSEITQLEDILGSTDVFLTGLTPKILAGTLTYNCQRVNYYYVKDTVAIRNAIARMYNRSYSDYKYVLTIREDKDWNSYKDFLYPDEDALTWITNSKIINRLLEQGDSLTKERTVVFVFDFKKTDDRSSYVNFATSKGYLIEEQSNLKDTEWPFQLRISKYMLITPDNIARLTVELRNEAKKYDAFVEEWRSQPLR